MNNSLANALYDLGVLCKDTEIDALHNVPEFSGRMSVEVQDTFTIVQAKENKGRIWVKATRNSDGKVTILKDEAITAIDGMDPPRIAKAYNLNPHGGQVKLGKKRGRKPKHRPEEAA